MFLSVITVVRNDAGHIAQTLESVASQTVPVEHIVVDGASTDGTLEICSGHGGIKLVSERDRGIYDAMNKGLRMASGDWVLFLNSGDTFHNERAVEDLCARIPGGFDGDLIFCDIEREYQENGERKRTARMQPHILTCSYKEHIPCCHQGCLVKRETHLRHMYDLKYRLAADYEMMYAILAGGGKWLHVPCLLSCFLAGGVSDTMQGELRKEWIMIKCRGKKWKVPFYLVDRMLHKAVACVCPPSKSA